MKPEQVAWLLTRERHGGRTFVAIRRRVDREGVDDLYLFRGSAARELKDAGLAPAQAGWRGAGYPAGSVLGVHKGGPAAWNWATVREVLSGVRPLGGR